MVLKQTEICADFENQRFGSRGGASKPMLNHELRKVLNHDFFLFCLNQNKQWDRTWWGQNAKHIVGGFIKWIDLEKSDAETH